jgi:hypothetical protein
MKVDAVDEDFRAGKFVVRVVDRLLAPHSTAAQTEGLSEIEQLSALDVLSIRDGDGVGGQRLALLAEAAKESCAARRFLFFNVVQHDPSVGHQHAVIVVRGGEAAHALSFLFSVELRRVLESGERHFALDHQGSKAFLDQRVAHFGGGVEGREVVDGKRGCNVCWVDASNDWSVRDEVVEVALELVGLLLFLVEGAEA